jgi:Flp pilus assembly protein protease CpaA
MLAVVFWSAFFGAFFSVVFVLWKLYKSPTTANETRWEEGEQKDGHKQTFKKMAKKLTIPYGIAIGCGTILTLLI